MADEKISRQIVQYKPKGRSWEMWNETEVGRGLIDYFYHELKKNKNKNAVLSEFPRPL
jgi:hypothetical protein